MKSAPRAGRAVRRWLCRPPAPACAVRPPRRAPGMVAGGGLARRDVHTLVAPSRSGPCYSPGSHAKHRCPLPPADRCPSPPPCGHDRRGAVLHGPRRRAGPASSADSQWGLERAGRVLRLCRVSTGLAGWQPHPVQRGRRLPDFADDPHGRRWGAQAGPVQRREGAGRRPGHLPGASPGPYRRTGDVGRRQPLGLLSDERRAPSRRRFDLEDASSQVVVRDPTGTSAPVETWIWLHPGLWRSPDATYPTSEAYSDIFLAVPDRRSPC